MSLLRDMRPEWASSSARPTPPRFAPQPVSTVQPVGMPPTVPDSKSSQSLYVFPAQPPVLGPASESGLFPPSNPSPIAAAPDAAPLLAAAPELAAPESLPAALVGVLEPLATGREAPAFAPPALWPPTPDALADVPAVAPAAPAADPAAAVAPTLPLSPPGDELGAAELQPTARVASKPLAAGQRSVSLGRAPNPCSRGLRREIESSGRLSFAIRVLTTPASPGGGRRPASRSDNPPK